MCCSLKWMSRQTCLSDVDDDDDDDDSQERLIRQDVDCL